MENQETAEIQENHYCCQITDVLDAHLCLLIILLSVVISSCHIDKLYLSEIHRNEQ